MTQLVFAACSGDNARVMPRFVLLRHLCPASFARPSHWDFMLEWGDVLRTWELRELPPPWAAAMGVSNAAEQIVATPLPDHRLAYLDYEGPLSGDRGSVTRCDRGTFELTSDSATVIEIELAGECLTGPVRLEREGHVWRLSATRMDR